MTERGVVALNRSHTPARYFRYFVVAPTLTIGYAVIVAKKKKEVNGVMKLLNLILTTIQIIYFMIEIRDKLR